jgi:hypothetical protein
VAFATKKKKKKKKVVCASAIVHSFFVQLVKQDNATQSVSGCTRDDSEGVNFYHSEGLYVLATCDLVHIYHIGEVQNLVQ